MVHTVEDDYCDKEDGNPNSGVHKVRIDPEGDDQ